MDEKEEKGFYGGRLAMCVLALAGGALLGFLLGRVFRFAEPGPSEGPLSSEALRSNWAKAVSFDASADGIVY